jgi:peptidoglycan/LPS O-acetylase OafA/YrhL
VRARAVRDEGVHALHYRPDLDRLRAIAVLAVILFHAFPGILPGGFIGVDVFFVITGYLISSITFAGLEQGTFRFSDFYARRIKRIFLALLLVLAGCLAFGWFTLYLDEFRRRASTSRVEQDSSRTISCSGRAATSIWLPRARCCCIFGHWA